MSWSQTSRCPTSTGRYLELLIEVKAKRPNLEVILVTGQGSVDAAVAAVKAGPTIISPNRSITSGCLTVQRAVERKRFRERTLALEGMLEVKQEFEDLLGQSRR